MKICGFWMPSYEENIDWLIEQKQSLKVYEPFRQDCITKLDMVLDIYSAINDDIKDTVKRLEAPEAVKAFDQPHLEKTDSKISRPYYLD